MYSDLNQQQVDLRDLYTVKWDSSAAYVIASVNFIILKTAVWLARLQNTWPLSMGLQILLPQSCSHQINIKTEYKQHEISLYLSFLRS